MQNTKKKEKKSRLIGVLREGVTVIQMILFKKVRENLSKKYPDKQDSHISMLAGSITNELFGTINPDEKFKNFRRENRGTIEQELLGLAEELTELRPILSDSLRVLTLCEAQQGKEIPSLLKKASELGILVDERDIPLPSVFMTRVRELGARYNLIIPPVQIKPEEDAIIQ